MMKLYGLPPSPNTWQVRALAAHLGIAVDFVALDFAKGETRTPEFLAINPTGRTPALVDGDFKLWETLAVMQYLAGKVDTTLWPNDARTRADITRWQSWTLAHWTRDAWAPALTERLIKQIFKLGPPDEAVLTKATEAFNKEAAMLDSHLSRHKFLVGGALTIADFAAAAPLFYAKQSGLPIEPHKHIQAWFERVAALPCWRESAPQMAMAA